MKLEAGQAWQLDTQKEFDAFVKLMDEQRIPWYSTNWDYESFRKSKWKSVEVDEFDVLASFGKPTHYGKDLLKEDNMFKVGDRVKVVKATFSRTSEQIGLEGEIVEESESGNFRVKINEEYSSYYHNPQGLELVEESKWREVEREDKIGSDNGTLIVEQNTETKELRLTRGCFTGTLDEFEEAVKRKPEGDKHRIVYEWLIEKYKAKYPDYKKKVAYVVKLNDKVYKKESYEYTYVVDSAKKYENEEFAKELADDCGGTVEEVEL